MYHCTKYANKANILEYLRFKSIVTVWNLNMKILKDLAHLYEIVLNCETVGTGVINIGNILNFDMEFTIVLCLILGNVF